MWGSARQLAPVASENLPVVLMWRAGSSCLNMDLIWSLGLIVVVLLALNQMAGGRSSNVLRPVTGIVSAVFSLAVRLCLLALGPVVRLLGGTLKLPAGSPKLRDDKAPRGPTPPRWMRTTCGRLHVVVILM